MTFDRFEGVVDPSNVWVATSKDYAQLVHSQLPEIPERNILCEPCRRNTAPCIAYVCWHIKARNPKANIVVSPSDHLVTDPVEFRRVISNGLHFVAETDAIVTLGMKPNRPDTGYGYIQADLSVPSARNKEMFRVDSFREKPDLDTAKKYISQGNFYWNSGIFIWNVSTIVNAFRVYQPGISQIFEDLLPVYGTDQEQAAIDEAFPRCESISVTMPYWRRPRRYLSAPHNSAGATWAHGVRCCSTAPATSTEMPPWDSRYTCMRHRAA